MHLFADLIRLRQWVKNLFLIFPLIFSGKFLHLNAWLDCFLAFIGFSLVCSGMYIINDIKDAATDKVHPRKSKQPLALGFPFQTALLIAFLSLLIGLAGCFMLKPALGLVALFYIVLYGFYNLKGKDIVIVDVLIIGVGFQIRIWAGAFAVGVLPSLWLQMCVFVLALFLGFTKRSHELNILGQRAVEYRPVLTEYTKFLLDQIILICATLSIVFYGLYTISSEVVARIGNYYMLYSIPFVFYGIFRYLYLVQVRNIGDDPGDILLSDRPLFINILVWILFVMCLIAWYT
jgi:4-hydroxybenzoate polyprenyltransferase